MKRITFYFSLLLAITFSWQGISQTLNQSASWPNANWTVTGSYNTDPLAFEADPTVTANFAFDDDDAGSGSDDNIAAESPVIDLTAAHTAGETWVSISGDYVYNKNSGDVLQFEYWDADATTWNIIGAAFPADTATAPNGDFCSGIYETYTTATLNIAALTATQLSGFKYRISYDDTVGGPGWEWGFCFQSPTIVSATPPSCADVTVLAVANVDANNADLSWTENGSATLWNIELVDVTAGDAVTGAATSTGVTNPFTQTGLIAANDYEFYVQADCGGNGTSAWVGPFAFTTTIACPAPSNLMASNMTISSADLAWDAGVSETLWNIELVDITAGDVVTGVATSPGVSNPYTHGGLSTNNDYEYYVQADCGGGNGTSVWVGPFAFSSACNAFTAPYTQDFENGGTIPSCWSMSGGEDWKFNTSGPNHVGNGGTITGATTSGNYYAVVDASNADAAAVLLSPMVDVAGIATPSLSFYEISDNEGNANSQLNVEVWDGAAWNNVGTYNTNTTGWELKIIDLSTLTITGDIQARFTFSEIVPGDFYDDIAIDDVMIGELPVCSDVSALDVANVTTNSADLSWIENGFSTLWNIELVDVTAGGTVTGVATTTGVTNPYTQSGLSANNDYNFYVQSDCGGTTFGWIGPFSFSTPCNTFTAPYTEDFENAGDIPSCWAMSGGEDWFFNIAGPNHVGNGGTISGSTASGNYYAGVDASNADAPAVLLSPFIDVSGLTAPSLSFYEISDNEGNANSQLDVEVWDGAAWNSVATYNTNTSGWEQKIVDLSTLTITGDIRARFTFSELVPGDFYDDIAIDDVTFDELPACIDPGTLLASNITDTTADLSWMENGAATVWNLEVVDVTAGDVVTGTATASGVSNPYNLTGLMGDNAYEFYVQSDCGGGDLSAWVGPYTFTTPYVAVAPDCTNGTFLDSGGVSNDYSAGEAITYTICPDNAGESVSVTFTAFSTENNGAANCYDGLTVHDGADASAVTIDPAGGGTVWCWDRDDAVPGGTGDLQGMTITSSDASGCLTFVFTSDGSFNREGWEATVSCSVVSVDDINAENFTYYPNPVNNNILVLNSQRMIKNIHVTNLVGQKVLEISPNSNNHILQMNSLKAGVYFVKVLVEGGSEKTLKIIKD